MCGTEKAYGGAQEPDCAQRRHHVRYARALSAYARAMRCPSRWRGSAPRTQATGPPMGSRPMWSIGERPRLGTAGDLAGYPLAGWAGEERESREGGKQHTCQNWI
eukprot:1535561-Rhodomonas_salina.1